VGAYGHPFLLPIREGQQGKEIMAALQDADWWYEEGKTSKNCS
jgi:hypothetical protein